MPREDERQKGSKQSGKVQSYSKEEDWAPLGPDRAHKQRGQETDKNEQGGPRKEDANDNLPSEQR